MLEVSGFHLESLQQQDGGTTDGKGSRNRGNEDNDKITLNFVERCKTNHGFLFAD